jgi:hypothetical protein
MDWAPLSARADSLPLVLAGPIVRRVEPTAASVWVALKASDTVKLTVLQGETVVASNGDGEPTIALGDRLHVVVATATPVGAPLAPDVLYTYQLEFQSILGAAGADNFATALGEGILASIVYTGGAAGTEATLPSFSLPPQTLSLVKLAHTSCRKAHGEAADALPLLDGIIAAARQGATDAVFAIDRPHQLFFTGDQTYNDDVAPAMLAMCIDAAGWLMGTRLEAPPQTVGPLAPGPWKKDGWISRPPPDLLPAGVSVPWDPATPWPSVGQRGPHVFAAGFTVSPPDQLIDIQDLFLDSNPFPLSGTLPDGKPDEPTLGRYSAAANHLMLLGEFYAMSLLAWSPVLWNGTSPGAGEIVLPFINDKTTDAWIATSDGYTEYRTGQAPGMSRLRAFGTGLGAVRRVLANVPTYMVFDDHDVTDDWYMNREWCKRVLTSTDDTLGRRIVRNGLISYAVMQAWGNTPAQFVGAPPALPAGANLLGRLDAGEPLSAAAPAAGSTVPELVGMPAPLDPPPGPGESSALVKSATTVVWNYTWAPAGWPFEVIVLDSRTVRGYLPSGLAGPIILDDGQNGTRVDQYGAQIPAPDHPLADRIVSIVVVQTPLLGERSIEALAHAGSSVSDVFGHDQESWSFAARGYEGLLSRLVAHNPLTVVLSGDVHYSFANALDYSATRPWNEAALLAVPRTGRVVQLTSSSARNETKDTQTAHVMGATIKRLDAVHRCGSHVLPRNRTSLAPSEQQLPAVFDATTFAALYSTAPDWTYAITPIPGTLSNPQPPAQTASTSPFDVGGYVSKKWHSNDGANLVGVNNIAIASFSGDSPAEWHVQQVVYWRSNDSTGRGTTPSRTTSFDVSLLYETVPAQ